MREPRTNPPSPTDGAGHQRRATDRPAHPTGQAAVLLVVVTLAIVGLAALSAWGLI